MKFFVFPFLVILLFCDLAKGQLCNGNLGDPIVNTTFGNTRQPLARKTTSYDYVRGCPSPGQYTIANFLLGCGDRTWVQLVGDHTGDYNGDYMLVNAESKPGNVYIDTATGLCSNTTYQFSAWISSVMQKYTCNGNALLPDIILTAETLSGQVLASFNTGKLPLATEKIWKEYGVCFSTPTGISTVLLRISIKPDFGCGSAFALDDITLKVCGPPVSVTINGNNSSSLQLCENYSDPIVLHATYGSGFASPALQWQSSIDSGKTWKNLEGETTNTYTLPHLSVETLAYRLLMAEDQNINSPNCRITSSTVLISVHPLPAHKAPENILGCLLKELVLPYPDELAQTVQWEGPNNYFSTNRVSIIPSVRYTDTGLYKFHQSFNYGCSSLDTFYLKAAPSVTISAPTSYTLCESGSVVLSASGGEKYKWTPSPGLSNDTIANPVASPKERTQYKVTISNFYGCKDSAFVNVDLYKKPIADAGNNITIIKGDTATLHAKVGGTSVNVSWTPPSFINDNNSATPKIYPQSDIRYTLNVTSLVGCGIATSAVTIKVYDNIYVPSAFTPNNDGLNDKFRVTVPSGYNLEKFVVYDRWGQKVYSGGDAGNGWDGNVNDLPQQTGTFVYEVEMKSPLGRKIFKKGTVILIR